MFLALSAATVLGVTEAAKAEDLQPIVLPKPSKDGGKSVLAALWERRTNRNVGADKLSPQMLSDLLWAAHGINRADTGKRTAPSAKDCQEIEIYVVTAEGAWLHDVKANCLKTVAKGDFRKLTGKQDFVGTAPLNLVYVADTTKMKKCTPEELPFYAATDTGFVSQNVYLFCASEGLGTVVRMTTDRPALAAALKLSDTARITLAQTVGQPKR